MDTQTNSRPQRTDRRRQLVARKNIGVAVFLGIFFGPLGYVYVRAFEPAALNILTLNYLLFGIIIVPIHTAIIIRAARKEVLYEEPSRSSERLSTEVQSSSD